MWSLDPSTFLTAHRKKIFGTILHVVATQFYLLFIAILFVTWMEVWKGIELLHKIRNAWFTFGGAREMIAYALICFVIGRLIDVYAKKLNPHFKHNPERGWHYRH